jgi:hypothetical protein
MSKADAYEADLLKLLLNATPIANVADNAVTSPLTNLYVALHTADPGDTGNQTTSEIAYTGYARVAVLRNNGTPAWTISGTSPSSASPNAAITFGQMTAGAGGTASFFSVGSLISGAGRIFYSGAISPTIAVTNGVTPQLSTATALTED